jgi:hypothetical protein
MSLWLHFTRRRAVALFAILVFALPARGEPAMWIIKDKDSTIYLLGTIHILRPDTLWNVPKIKQALGESTELWMEIADLEGDTISLLAKYGVDPKKQLSTRLKPEQMERLRQAAEQYTFPLELLEPMKPWYAALTFAMLPLAKAGYSVNAGVEMSLRLQARLEGDKIVGLETMEQQLQMMDGTPEKDQIAYLMETLEDVEEGLALLERLTKAWSEGHVDAVMEELTAEMKREAPALYRRMFTERNLRWSRQIAALLKRSGVQFIAVGAGHLGGPDSVQAQLAKRGIKAERY